MTRKKEAVDRAAMPVPHASSEPSADGTVSLCDDLFEAHKGRMPEYR